jgi:WD40 repeat protein
VLATGSADGTGRLWAVETGRPLAVAVGHTQAVSAVAFPLQASNLLMRSGPLTMQEDNVFLTTASHDGTVRLWSVVTEP